MSIIEVVEKRDSQTGSWKPGESSATREFWVYSDTVSDSILTVKANLPVSIGMAYSVGAEYDYSLTCRTIDVSRGDILKGNGLGSIYRWDVRAEYSTPEKGSNQQQQEDENPLLRPVIITGGTTDRSKTTQYDKDDEPIENTAGELYPPIEIFVPGFEVQFVRNEASSPAGKCIEYVRKINSQKIWGGDPRTWMCTSITYEKLFENTYVYYKTTYKFLYDPDEHILQILSNGFNELKAGKLVKIKLEDGTFPTEPQGLKSDGSWTKDNDQVAQQTKYLYKEIPFQSLGLPTSI